MSSGSLDNNTEGPEAAPQVHVDLRGSRPEVSRTVQKCREQQGGACTDPLDLEHLRAMALTERDCAIIEFERSWWSEDASKESLIRDRFELSTTRYYELLGELVDSDEAYSYDPLLIRRLRRLRDRRRRARFEREIEQPPAR